MPKAMQIPIQLSSRHPARNPFSLKKTGLRFTAGVLAGPDAVETSFSGCCRAVSWLVAHSG
jgi:hypothetical protein